ncbi:MAG: ferrous iron transporter B [Clostridia bacterium]|nr:ferrous iron transporter B [Clostridia bacterium]
MEHKIRAALAGNPNVGKSTVFNALTGLHQHTGNWPGKTVECAEGTFTVDGCTVFLTDLPGIYSLASHSAEEDAAREFLLTRPDITVVVCDASSLERSLILWGQIASTGIPVLLCVNLMDEAEKRGISIDRDTLRARTGCPVVFTSARSDDGMEELRRAILTFGGAESPKMAENDRNCAEICQNCAHCGGNCPENGGKCPSGTEFYVRQAQEIASACVTYDPCTGASRRTLDTRIDRWICGRFTAFPIMLAFTALLFLITVHISGFLSDALGDAADFILGWVTEVFAPHLPQSLASLLFDGVLGTVLEVISVMLPPMAIFFPLFTLLEDLGYLPRAAFNLDRCFACAGSCGKQSLTMLMGLGCSAAGVMGCRIIDSPRERLIAVLTNSFIPCSGRLPILFAMLAAMGHSSLFSAVTLMGLLILAIAVTLLVSKFLSVTILRGQPSSFTLELPPYRMPQIGRTVARSLLDRCIFVLGRAITASAPAGAVIWLTVHWEIGGIPLYSHLTRALDPIGKLAGMDGVLMLSFLLALPAAELVLPLASAGYTLTGAGMPEFAPVTCLAVILFTMFHFPCATTLLTIRRECRNEKHGWQYPLLAAVIPTVIGYGMCVVLNLLF